MDFGRAQILTWIFDMDFSEGDMAPTWIFQILTWILAWAAKSQKTCILPGKIHVFRMLTWIFQILTWILAWAAQGPKTWILPGKIHVFSMLGLHLRTLGVPKVPKHKFYMDFGMGCQKSKNMHFTW